MNIVIVGVGLIGGSFSLALNSRDDLVFAGVDEKIDALEEAKKLGIISRSFSSLPLSLEWADLIVLSIPVNGIKQVLPSLLDELRDGQLVVDFGSTKLSICDAVIDHPRRNQFLAAHPIAGTEHSGPKAAFPELFLDKNLILCESEKTEKSLLDRFESLALDAGFYLSKMDAKEHDRHLAYISHLSHITSYALSNTVLTKEKDGEVILDLAGSGFESTVRLAKSSPSMWSSIFNENRQMVLDSISAYQLEIEKLKHFIANEEVDKVTQYLEEGRTIRKILK